MIGNVCRWSSDDIDDDADVRILACLPPLLCPSRYMTHGLASHLCRVPLTCLTRNTFSPPPYLNTRLYNATNTQPTTTARSSAPWVRSRLAATTTPDNACCRTALCASTSLTHVACHLPRTTRVFASACRYCPFFAPPFTCCCRTKQPLALSCYGCQQRFVATRCCPGRFS